MSDDPAGQSDKSVAPVQSVDRALTVLEILGRWGTAGVTDIASEIGVHKSTVSRLIAVLESRGFVEQLSDRGKYRLGFSIVRLAGSTSARMDIPKQSQPLCDELALATGETVNVAILDDASIINIVEAIGPAEITLRSWVGQSCPATATSSGKVLLAGRSDAAVRSLVGTKFGTYTASSITDVATLLAELADARRNGWASVREELEVGLNAVAAPIRDGDGDVVAAISVSGPAYRLTPERFPDVAAQVRDVAAQIGRRLGHLE
ncbi:IclR family transcriptional regulator [Gordonia sp. TBRC 11910]|uniref:Glycerol operon regulatory protein n=1 Tax=Gordonia asplenii TaxID=2725283 RepID=A0A848KU57_9ACTN|nr:IclR family transcriptional regulator [Gordonia asplenii]NMO01739.1 IclR family transcriptional regulator [Gordonia asplenii]